MKKIITTVISLIVLSIIIYCAPLLTFGGTYELERNGSIFAFHKDGRVNKNLFNIGTYTTNFRTLKIHAFDKTEIIGRINYNEIILITSDYGEIKLKKR